MTIGEIVLMKPHESPRINKKSIRGDSRDSWPVWNRGINPELPRMTTNTTTVPLGMIPIPLRQSYDLDHAHNPIRLTPTSLNGLNSS